VQITFSWMPEPVDLASCSGFGLSEFTLHRWDVSVAFDDASSLRPSTDPRWSVCAPPIPISIAS
jgi:hypothetical protein